MRELFIYYRVPVHAAAAAREAVAAMQERLRRRHPGLTARLMRRPDEREQQQTWMEIYAMQGGGTTEGVTPQIEADIARAAAAALARFAVGARHTEVFVPCAS